MNRAYLLTGGNIGDRLTYLQQACSLVEKTIGFIFKKSDIYETAPWGLKEQNAFLNQVILVSTTLPPEKLLATVLLIEQQLGRKRIEKLGPRTIDIDILFFNSEILSSPRLTVPHPEIEKRRFVLTPLNQIAPEFVHPVLKKTVSQLLEICPDMLQVKNYISADS